MGKKKNKFKVYKTESNTYTVYTDGSSLGNPGPGGVGVVIRLGDTQVELSDGYYLTTNNRMEILAACLALENITGKRTVNLHTDSAYVINGITKWIWGWRKRGWITGEGLPVKNKDLWMRLDNVRKKHNVRFIKVPAHSGVILNELADTLAKNGSNNPTLIDEGYLAEINANGN